MQTRLSIISNILFKYTLIFLISFLWIEAYIDNLIVVTICAFVSALVVGKILGMLYHKKQESISITLKEQEMIYYASKQLLLCSDYHKIIDFFLQILSSKENVIATDREIFWDNNVLIPLYNYRKISLDKIIEIYKTYKKYNNIIIVGIGYEEGSCEFIKTIYDTNIHLLDEKSAFKIFKKHNLFPEFNIKLKEKDSFKLTSLKKLILSKRNTRNYFASGIVILISSVFIQYNIYYICFATLLFIMSGLCFFKKETPTPSIIDEL